MKEIIEYNKRIKNYKIYNQLLNHNINQELKLYNKKFINYQIYNLINK
jgi:hypothetical protein